MGPLSCGPTLFASCLFVGLNGLKDELFNTIPTQRHGIWDTEIGISFHNGKVQFLEMAKGNTLSSNGRIGGSCRGRLLVTGMGTSTVVVEVEGSSSPSVAPSSSAASSSSEEEEESIQQVELLVAAVSTLNSSEHAE